MACPHASTCPLVRIFAGKPSLRVWTKVYCEGNYGRCARVFLASYGQEVPPTLLPNGQSLDGPAQADPAARC